MKRRLEISELIFKIISYVLLTAFALCCLYPFVYAVSASVSGKKYVENGMREQCESITIPLSEREGVTLVSESAGITLRAVLDDNGVIVGAETEENGQTVPVKNAVRSAAGELLALSVRDAGGRQLHDAEGGDLYAAVVWYHPEEGIGIQNYIDTLEGKFLIDAPFVASQLEQIGGQYSLTVARVQVADGKPATVKDPTVSALALECERLMAEGQPLTGAIHATLKQDDGNGGVIPASLKFDAGIEKTISGDASVRRSTETRKIVLLPKAVQFDAFSDMFARPVFWSSYSNTLFLTVYGTVWSLIVAILGAYALSKKRLLFRKFFNFFLVFTMWFSAGIIPQYQNYLQTRNVFHAIAITDDKWMIVIAMGMAAMNVILLRNAFENVPSEIEEAAIVDGATEWQVLRQVFIPMTKSTIATVTLFFAISRWNGYFWAKQMVQNNWEWPLQVYIRNTLEALTNPDGAEEYLRYASESLIYSLIVCSIIPILVIYPFIQKYFAKGTNAGGVKE